MLLRLVSKLELGLTREPMDLDYMEFTCRQELYLCNALSRHVNVPTEMLHALQELFRLTMEHTEWTRSRNIQVDTLPGVTGCPRLDIERERLTCLCPASQSCWVSQQVQCLDGCRNLAFLLDSTAL